MIGDGLVSNFARFFLGHERVHDAPEAIPHPQGVQVSESATQPRVRKRRNESVKKRLGRVRGPRTLEPSYHVDPFIDWLTTVEDPDGEVQRMHYTLLMANYLLWAESNNVVPLSQKTLQVELGKRSDRVSKGRPRKVDKRTGRVERLPTKARSPVRGTYYTIEPRRVERSKATADGQEKPCMQEAA